MARKPKASTETTGDKHVVNDVAEVAEAMEDKSGRTVTQLEDGTHVETWPEGEEIAEAKVAEDEAIAAKVAEAEEAEPEAEKAEPEGPTSAEEFYRRGAP